MFRFKKKEKIEIPLEVPKHWDHYGWQWSLGEKADATACLWS